MTMIAAILAGVISSSVVLQSFFAIFSPSSYGRFAELPVILLYSFPIVAIFFLVFGLPYLLLEQKWTSQPSALRVTLVGFVLGAFVQAGVLAVTNWAGPSLANKIAYLVAGGIGGAASIGVYFGLSGNTRGN